MTESPYIIDVTQENYAELMETSFRVPVLLDFWASWCQPCQVLMPILAGLAEEYAGKFILGKLNTEEEPEIAAQFAIRSIPTVKLFRDGQPVDGFMGAMPEGTIREMLDRNVGRESDTQVADARERLADGDAESAIALLIAAREADPDNARVIVALAEARATTGDIDGAERALAGLPMSEQEKPAIVALRNRLFFHGQVAAAPDVAELEERLDADADDHEARFQLALRKAINEDYETALELLLTLMQKDREYGDDAGRRGLVKVFDVLGDDPLVSQYRRRMASLMY